MGGNALSVPSTRMCKGEYIVLTASILNILDMGEDVKVIPAYSEKEYFGDMDILYRNVKIENILVKLKRIFNITEIVKNGDVTSVGILLKDDRVFQLDFIKGKEDLNTFMFSYYYFSYNDLGNLIGRVARRCGLKFGHDGLWYIQRDGDRVLYKHLLSTDFFDTIEYLGFDVEQYNQGFNNLEDIFDFVIDSKYYNFSHFDLAQRNYKARTRDRKRPTYMKFIKYVQNKGIDKSEDPLYLLDHFAKFPEFYVKYKSIERLNNYKKEYKEKFNGNLIMKLTRLEGKELGHFINYCKKDPKFSLNQILTTDQESINKSIENKYRDFLSLEKE